jgi:class 3 adenylate cyclase
VCSSACGDNVGIQPEPEITDGQAVEDPAAAGLAALGRHEWRLALELLHEADRREPLAPEGLEALAEAAFWTGQVDDLLDARHRAFTGYVNRGDTVAAALVALELVSDHTRRLEQSIAAGWLKRAERLLVDQPESRAHAYLDVKYARSALARGELESVREHAERAVSLARRFGDGDAEALALHTLGYGLLMTGEVDEGLGLIDEATTAAIAGELLPVTTAIIYCNTISACHDLGDFKRAGEWTDRVTWWCSRQSIEGHGFPGVCRVHRAEVLRLRGAWAEAEHEVRRACEELEGYNLIAAAEGFYELGEIRSRVGDFRGAEEAYSHAHELGRDPQPGLALLRLADGQLEAARACIDRAVAEAESDRFMRARLLPAQVEIAVAAGDPDRARAAVVELEETAAVSATPSLAAAAAAARGTLTMAEGAAETAIASFRQARQLWQQIDLPFEAARTRLALATAYRAVGDNEAATLELRAARSVFERLGATPDARRASELLGDGAAPEAHRVARTFLFTDMCRSTNLVEALGDEAWQNLLSWHDQTLRAIFATHGGEEVDHAGDGFFVAFRDPATALEAARSMQRTLAEHRRTHGFAPEVRIGVHATEALFGGDAYQGRGVHEAARIAALAGAGEILATRGTLEAVGERVDDARSVTLKGIASPVEVAAVSWG